MFLALAPIQAILTLISCLRWCADVERLRSSLGSLVATSTAPVLLGLTALAYKNPVFIMSLAVMALCVFGRTVRTSSAFAEWRRRAPVWRKPGQRSKGPVAMLAIGLVVALAVVVAASSLDALRNRWSRRVGHRVGGPAGRQRT